MTYKKLVQLMSRSTGISPNIIRAVIDALPEALMQDTVGGLTRTPLGSFIMRHRKRRRIMLPDKKTASAVPGSVLTELRVGARMKVQEDSPKWSYFFSKGEEESPGK